MRCSRCVAAILARHKTPTKYIYLYIAGIVCRVARDWPELGSRPRAKAISIDAALLYITIAPAASKCGGDDRDSTNQRKRREVYSNRLQGVILSLTYIYV